MDRLRILWTLGNEEANSVGMWGIWVAVCSGRPPHIPYSLFNRIRERLFRVGNKDSKAAATCLFMVMSLSLFVRPSDKVRRLVVERPGGVRGATMRAFPLR